jgi:hypothetical protein
MVEPTSETVGRGPTNDPGGVRATAGAATRAIAAEAKRPTKAALRGRRRGADRDTEDLDLISGLPVRGMSFAIAVRGERTSDYGQPDGLYCPDLILTRCDLVRCPVMTLGAVARNLRLDGTNL